MLVHSSQNRLEGEDDEVRQCGNLRRKCCPHMQENNKFSINEKEHKVCFGGTCKSSNVIYGVRCKKRNLWYIGETSMKLHERLNQHRYWTNKLRSGGSIDKTNDTGLAEHFALKDHDFNNDLEMHLLERGKWKTPMERKAKESFYICRHSTQEPQGMNKNAGFLADLYEKVNGRIGSLATPKIQQNRKIELAVKSGTGGGVLERLSSLQGSLGAPTSNKSRLKWLCWPQKWAKWAKTATMFSIFLAKLIKVSSWFF